MNPEIWADDSGFLGSPRSAPVTARFGGAGAEQPRHAYQIHVYRATVRDCCRPLPVGYAPRMWSLRRTSGSADRRLSLRYSRHAPSRNSASAGFLSAIYRFECSDGPCKSTEPTCTRHLMPCPWAKAAAASVAAGGGDPERGGSRPIRSSRTLRQTSLLSPCLDGSRAAPFDHPHAKDDQQRGHPPALTSAINVRSIARTRSQSRGP
jgi:hypothetical protein